MLLMSATVGALVDYRVEIRFFFQVKNRDIHHFTLSNITKWAPYASFSLVIRILSFFTAGVRFAQEVHTIKGFAEKST